MLHQEIIYQSEGKIWRLLLDEKQDILVLELRFEELQEVSFSAFDLATSQPIWEDFMLEETWWVSTHAAIGGRLYLSEWEEDAPVSKSVIAISLREGEGLWQKNDMAFLSANETQVLLQANADGKQIVANAHTGTESTDSWQVNSTPSQLQLPSRYTEDSAYFQTVAKFISQKLGVEAHLTIDYLETEQHICLCFYQKEDIHFTQRLIIANLEGEILQDTVLNENLKGSGLESFMLWKQQLYFVKGKRELVKVELMRNEE